MTHKHKPDIVKLMMSKLKSNIPTSRLSPEQHDALTHNRILSDAELLKNGARIVLGSLRVTPEQYDAVRKEMTYDQWRAERDQKPDQPRVFQADFLVKRSDMTEFAALGGNKTNQASMAWTGLLGRISYVYDYAAKAAQLREHTGIEIVSLRNDPTAEYDDKYAITGLSLHDSLQNQRIWLGKGGQEFLTELLDYKLFEQAANAQ